MGRLLRQLARDDRGQDLIEYALLTGAIAVGAMLLFPAIQARMGAAYQRWNDNAYAISETPPPM